MTASTISSRIASKSILDFTVSRSRPESSVGEGGGVCSIALSSVWDRFCRLLGCASGASEPDEGDDKADEAALDKDDEDDLEAFLEAAAAARAACVIGTCMPRLGKDSDLRRVL
jgi:hypothetical protein